VPHLGHSCRGIAALIAVSLGTASCATMTPHRMGPVGDPDTERQMDQLAAQEETFAEIRTPVTQLDARLGAYRVLGSQPGALMLEARDAPVPVPLGQITCLRKFDRARGAYETAVRAGAAGFFVGLVTGTLLALADRPADETSRPNPAVRGLEYGLLTSVVGAVVGAALGATVNRGHEDRYWPSPQ